MSTETQEALTPFQRKLFERGVPMARRLAERYHRKLGAPFEKGDLESGALQGLWVSVREYEPDRGVPFSKYAYLRMKRGLIDEVRRIAPRAQEAYKKAVALRFAATAQAHELSEGALDLLTLGNMENMSPAEIERSLDATLASFEAAIAIGLLSPAEDVDHAVDPEIESKLHESLQLKSIRSELDQLEDREKMLVQAICLDGRSTVDVARELNCDHSWVSRMYWRAIGKLRKRLAARNVT